MGFGGGWSIRWWCFALPRPFVPGHPHPDPLPLSGRGELSSLGDGYETRS